MQPYSPHQMQSGLVPTQSGDTSGANATPSDAGSIQALVEPAMAAAQNRAPSAPNMADPGTHTAN